LNILEKSIISKIVKQYTSEHTDIEVIDYDADYYADIILLNDFFNFRSSIFTKLCPALFSIHSMTNSEYAFWRSLIAFCFIKGYRMTLKTYDDYLSVLELDYGFYLSIRFKINADTSTIDHIVGYGSFNGFKEEKYYCYEDLLDRLLFPLLNHELQEFGMSINSIDDLTDENLLIFSALSI